MELTNDELLLLTRILNHYPRREYVALRDKLKAESERRKEEA